MKTYLVRLRRVIEWEQMYEADSPEVAVDLAKLEAHHGTIVDEIASVAEAEVTTLDAS